MKKVIAIMLTLAMLACTATSFGISASEAPAGTPVSTIEDFIAMDPSGVYYLANDIDFSGATYTRNIYAKEFKGVLDGNGHSLLGITIETTNDDAGIFANWFAGTLKNIVIGSEEEHITVTSTGAAYSVAAIAGTMLDGATLENVVIYADVTGDGKTSGIASYIRSGKVKVTNCAVYGTITGNPAAGFFALSNDSSGNIEIQNSFNYAAITGGNSSAGGFYTVVANVNGGRSGNLKITGCANFGTVSATDWRCGGIVGEFHEDKGSTLTVDYCYNRGAITMKGSGGIACGIVGGASFDAPSGKRTITNVYNAGEVKNTANASNAYAIAFSNHDTANATVTNAAYLDGNATHNIATTNAVKVASVDELIATVTAYTPSAEGNTFIAPSAGANGGYPILAHEAVSHENVKEYACGRRVCLDCNKTLSKASEEKHTFVDDEVQPNGYLDGYITATCSACGETQKKAGKPSAHKPTFKDGAYEIASADHLKWYQANLEASLVSGRESLVLTADLDMKNESFTPIGSKAHPFSGKFNGAGHKISQLKVASDSEGGLFGVLSIGAVISMLEIEKASVEAVGAAGAVFGAVMSGAIVKIEWIVVSDSTVVSKSEHAGGIAGSTDKASSVAFSQCAVDTVTIKGARFAGGVAGFGNGSDMKNCYSNATLSAEKQAYVGSIAYYTGNFTNKYCGYARNAAYGKSVGTAYDAKAFAEGKIAHLINAYSNQKVMGTNGKKTVMDTPVYGVYFGEKQTYTTALLADTGDVEVYTDGKVVAIAVKRESGPRLTDLAIKVTAGGKTVEIKLSDLTLTRRVTLNGTLYTVADATALYTITLEGATAYTIGTFSGSVVTK